MDQQPVEIPEDVKVYLENILKDANMTYLDEQTHQDMLTELYSQLDNFLTSVIVDKMPPEYIDEFIKLNNESATKEQAQKFIQDHLPTSQQVLSEAFVQFRDMYVHNVSVAKGEETATNDQTVN